MEKRLGEVHLIGAGPGDPGLITEKAASCLKRCDTVVYDHLASERLLSLLPQSCERIYAGKQAGRHSMKQEEINRVLVEKAREGRRVARLKGGDPFVFGRGGEEVEALRGAGIPYEVIPGVTSATAALCSAGIPITHRGVSRSFHVMTGHTLRDGEEEGTLPPDFEAFAGLSGTLVFLMGLGNLPAIVKGLLKSGKPGETPAAVIENGTLPAQRVARGTLGTIEELAKEKQIGTPAIIVVGETAAYDMSGTLKKPLSGLRVGITGTKPFADKLEKLLEEQGAGTERVCELGLEAYADAARMRQAYRELNSYSWTVFTSANAVRLFFGGLFKNDLDNRALGHLKLACVGKGTARELKAFGFLSDYTPETYTVKSLALGLCERVKDGERLLIPRSLQGSADLTEILGQAGISYDDIALYRTVGKMKEEGLEEQMEGLDYLTFASASGVEAFFEGNGVRALSGRTKIACIGDITAAALESRGRKADIIAAEFSIPGMAEAICADAEK